MAKRLVAILTAKRFPQIARIMIVHLRNACAKTILALIL
jgi:hypothetical protein